MSKCIPFDRFAISDNKKVTNISSLCLNKKKKTLKNPFFLLKLRPTFSLTNEISKRKLYAWKVCLLKKQIFVAKHQQCCKNPRAYCRETLQEQQFAQISGGSENSDRTRLRDYYV